MIHVNRGVEIKSSKFKALDLMTCLFMCARACVRGVDKMLCALLLVALDKSICEMNKCICKCS